MKITIVQGAFLPVPPLMGGAVEKVWFALGKEFARRGHVVSHLSRAHPDLPPQEVIEGVRHLRVTGFDTPRRLAVLKFLDLIYSLRILRQLPPADILVTNTFWLPILVRAQKPGRLYVHAARYPKGQMRFYRHAARIQTVSTAIAEAICAEAPALAPIVRVLPYPLPKLEEPATNLATEKRILYVGRVHPEKGLELLLEAMLRLPAAVMAGWKLVIVGPSETKHGGGGSAFLAQLQRLAEPLGERVEFVGPIFDPAELVTHYQRASLFLYPSLAERGETFGLAPLEAMAQGCAPLVSDLACFRDFITDETTGFVFDHRRENAAEVLASKIIELTANEDKLRQTGLRARAKAQAYRLNLVADQYLTDFQAVLHG